MSPAPESSAQGHARDKSSLFKPVHPPTSTTGPLDAHDDPLSSPGTPPTARAHDGLARPSSGITNTTTKDFSFLLRPEIYHPITPLNVPLAFRHSPKQPDAGGDRPEDLLARGHFRAAAVAAVQELTGTTTTAAGASRPGGGVDPRDAKRILELVYTRLACLTLMDATPLAAQEVKALGDLGSASTYVDEATDEHLVPWPLRVLNVRLQALGFGDPRRAVMSYHELAREARARIAEATAAAAKCHSAGGRGEEHSDDCELWKERLHGLGIKVASALVEMDDLPGAAHLLHSLRGGGARLEMSRALLWLQLGDADAARACARNCTVAADSDKDKTKTTEQVILALCDMAESDFEAALAKWQALRSEWEDEMASVNAATCLLYLGRIAEGRDILEELVDKGYSSHTLLFNLATMYELCTEKNRDLKLKLTERVAAMDESPAGWEKTNADFKL